MEPTPCYLCGLAFLEGELVIPVLTHGEEPHVGVTGVHLRCLRPHRREDPPVPPTLTDEDLDR